MLSLCNKNLGHHALFQENEHLSIEISGRIMILNSKINRLLS